MASEAVEVIISADDQASKKFAETAAALEKEMQAIDAAVAKALKEEEAALKRVEELRNRELDQLALIETELKQGKQAAISLSLQQQGLSKQEADQLAKKRMELERISKLQSGPDGFRQGAGRLKATTEFAGSMSMLFGGSQFGQIAGQMAQLTERTSQFSEVAKQSGAAAMLMKAGLVAAAGVISYQIGSAIGNWIFQQEDLNSEIEKTASLMREQSGDALKKLSQEFRDKREDISLLPNKNTQKAELRALLAETEASFAKEEALYNSKKDLEDAGDKASADAHKARMRQLAEQRDELQRALSGRDEQIAKQKEINAEMDKSKAFVANLEKEVALMKLKGDEAIRAKAAQETFGAEDTSKAVALMKEKEALDAVAKAEAEAEQKKQQAAEKAKQKAEQIEQLKQRELQTLEERRIALEQGEEAARRYALVQQGLDEQSAAQIARQEQKLAQLEAQKNAVSEPLQARESRLLARGPVDNTKELIKQQVEQLASIDRGIETLANARNVRFVEVL